MDILINLAYGVVCFGVGILVGSAVEKIKAVKRDICRHRFLVLKPTESTVQYLMGGKFRAKSN